MLSQENITPDYTIAISAGHDLALPIVVEAFRESGFRIKGDPTVAPVSMTRGGGAVATTVSVVAALALGGLLDDFVSEQISAEITVASPGELRSVLDLNHQRAATTEAPLAKESVWTSGVRAAIDALAERDIATEVTIRKKGD